jgi:flagellar biosynthesis/type III secretory pathway chaperone
MTLKEQLLQEIEQASDSLLEDLLNLCRQMKVEQKTASLDDRSSSEKIADQRDAVRRLQAKVRETIPEGRSLVDELIAERRMEGKNE